VTSSFHIFSFGCRTNQSDSAALRQDFLGRGYQEAWDWREAGIIVVNSCTVTHRSDQQVRQRVRRFHRGNAAARIVVTGCYAQRDPESLSRIPGVEAVIGNTHKSDLIGIVDGTKESPLTADELADVYRQEFVKVRTMEGATAGSPGLRVRPFVKVQDGCDAKCTYCIIPLVRGPGRSLPPEQVLAQVRQLTRKGFQEVVLTGIHIGTYGLHMKPRYSLGRLLADVAETPGLVRVRLSSIEPMELSRRVIQLAAGNDKICPHFHICLQSGSNRILRKMLRPYNTSRFGEIVQEIRATLPQAAIGTDLVVGFPGETPRDHLETVRFVQAMPFTYLHVFPYSDRPGTRASAMRPKVDPRVRRQRCWELRQISAAKNRAFRRRFMGRKLSVLTLGESAGGRWEGISANYIKIRFPVPVAPNRMVQVEAVGETEDGLAGHPGSACHPSRTTHATA
jgi:threonylcarbamoyladenosine tRNA methylthiotransferase MtaB